MNLTDALLTPGPGDEPRRTRTTPPGWEPGYEWNGATGSLRTTGLAEQPKTWDAFITDAGLDPAEVSVVGPVQVRGWDAPAAGGDVVRMHYYRLTLARRTSTANIDELIAVVNRRRPSKATPTGDSAFVFAAGDLQLGKIDGDGIEGTVNRYLGAVDRATDRLKALRRTTPVGHIHLAYLGDCIEGFVSQGGANAWRTQLTLTEQIRLLRRLMLHTITTFAPLAEKVTVVSVPGNHDEAVRFGKGVTRYDDSHAVDALHAVADALTMNPAAFGHVQVLTPAMDELTVTATIAGTTITHAHGHQWGREKHFVWWRDQSFGEFPAGASQLLLAGHMHHLVVDTKGRKAFIQVPSLELESTWWRHRTGEAGNPGVATFLTRDGAWTDLAVV